MKSVCCCYHFCGFFTVITAISVIEGEIPSRGTKEFLVYKYYEKTHPPHYWTQFHNRISTKEWNTQRKVRPFKVTDVDKKTYDEIVRIFKSTWGLFPPNVVSIQRIENIYLFDQYQQECQRLFRKAVAEGKITPIKKARGSSGSVVTTKLMDKTWRDHLYPEINEHYLFHGTSVDNVDVIISHGFDCRLSNGGRVGFGVYGAEKSAKSKAYVGKATFLEVAANFLSFIRIEKLFWICLIDIHNLKLKLTFIL